MKPTMSVTVVSTTDPARAGSMPMRFIAIGIMAPAPAATTRLRIMAQPMITPRLGSSNQINIVHATVEALRMLEQPEAVAARRGLTVEEVTPAALLKARIEVPAGVSQEVSS